MDVIKPDVILGIVNDLYLKTHGKCRRNEFCTILLYLDYWSWAIIQSYALNKCTNIVLIVVIPS